MYKEKFAFPGCQGKASQGALNSHKTTLSVPGAGTGVIVARLKDLRNEDVYN